MSDSFATPWAVPCQAPLSMGCLRQEYWSGLPFPSPEDLPGLEIKPPSPAWQVGSLPLSHKGNPSSSISSGQNLSDINPFNSHKRSMCI